MENLRQLMAAYFHQDWWDEYQGRWESAVDDFVRREPHRVAGTTDEIEDLLKTAESDQRLGQVLDDLGNFRDAGDAPDAHRSWLIELTARLSRSDGRSEVS